MRRVRENICQSNLARIVIEQGLVIVYKVLCRVYLCVLYATKVESVEIILFDLV